MTRNKRNHQTVQKQKRQTPRIAHASATWTVGFHSRGKNKPEYTMRHRTCSWRKSFAPTKTVTNDQKAVKFAYVVCPSVHRQWKLTCPAAVSQDHISPYTIEPLSNIRLTPDSHIFAQIAWNSALSRWSRSPINYVEGSGTLSQNSREKLGSNHLQPNRVLFRTIRAIIPKTGLKWLRLKPDQHNNWRFFC